MWERALHRLLNSAGSGILSGSHPAYDERFQHFVDQLKSDSEHSTPSWYIFVHNAIHIVTTLMPEAALPELLEKAGGIYGVSARILPLAYAHLGHLRPPTDDHWWMTIAELLLSNDRHSQRLGLWFLIQLAPHAAIGFYDGLSSEDEAMREIYKRALISIEPMYEAYLPRLMTRFRETAQEDQQLEYKLHIATYLVAAASVQLGEDRADSDPMQATFFDDEVDADDRPEH